MHDAQLCDFHVLQLTNCTRDGQLSQEQEECHNTILHSSATWWAKSGAGIRLSPAEPFRLQTSYRDGGLFEKINATWESAAQYILQPQYTDNPSVQMHLKVAVSSECKQVIPSQGCQCVVIVRWTRQLFFRLPYAISHYTLQKNNLS